MNIKYTTKMFTGLSDTEINLSEKMTVASAPSEQQPEFRINDAGGHDATGELAPVLYYTTETGSVNSIVCDETYRTAGCDAPEPTEADWVKAGKEFYFKLTDDGQIIHIIWASSIKHPIATI